ncbi:MAG: single-stranded DNA-binding protein [Lachnospiraceae bacterium]|nr:single-stranded DNA-binding protein [Lachnospiraceae bacterium]MCR5477616.1 single-stranded DNA-binding protein [Lachnospiraceae bacterium]
MNKVILMGRLTRDPEVRYGQGQAQTAVARYSIAVDRKFKRDGEPTADFFNCTSFGKQAEFVERYLRKGTKVVVSGRVENDNYTNKEGQQVYSVRVIVEDVEFAESKNAQGGSSEGGSQGASFAGAPSEGAGNDFMNVPDGIVEELPFN